MDQPVSLFKSKIAEHYHIIAYDIIPVEPGWAALAYKLYADGGKVYFLKVYDKKRNSIAYILKTVPVYLFFIDWLNMHTALKGSISEVVKTKRGEMLAEEEDYIYIIMEYIKGDTVGEKSLSDSQVRELADIVSQLHGITAPVCPNTDYITEKFSLPWLEQLKIWLSRDFKTLKPEIRDLIKPYLVSLCNQANALEIQSKQLSEQKLPLALCHTDIHNWNIIADENKIHLIDWEGIKYAPLEADIFGLYNEPYFHEFMKQYKKHHPSYEINRELLKYYMISRNLTDIWEGIEQLQFDELSSREFQKQLEALAAVCEENKENSRMFI
ncbi:aminoglycoside phosphotransferase family protein [Chryseobacterium sp. G0240]|uniref:phosphotransferase n=1 Tax=Chryseobacterium sp. G0240 TaxID=2487066 RepID=UPI000F45BE89|nr:phosphotransferase [Chryseobacterium sp. G0240]ROI02238.1 aminoglycoside phosphotransferase family protein [Chryseobacterium sp. G0240]